MMMQMPSPTAPTTMASGEAASRAGGGMIQANGPMRTSTAASSSLPGLNSVSGSIPALGNAAGASDWILAFGGKIVVNPDYTVVTFTPPEEVSSVDMSRLDWLI